MPKISLKAVNNSSISLQEGFKSFLTRCKLKNLSSATINSYVWQFNKFTSIIPANTEISEITSSIISEYITALQQQDIAITSINTSLTHIRAIVNYWTEMGHCREVKIKLLKAEQPIKEVYTDSELKLLLKKPDTKKCSFSEFRNYVAINFFIATGCRVRTLVNIKNEDVDFTNGLVKLTTTKNRKPQLLPLPQSMLAILTEYMKYRQGKPEDYLFCNDIGTQILTTSLAQGIAAYNRARGISKTSVHLFRHCFAKNFVLQGGDIIRLQKWLGHSSLEMSRRYCNLYDTDLANDFQKYNLMDRMSSNNSAIKMSK